MSLASNAGQAALAVAVCLVLAVVGAALADNTTHITRITHVEDASSDRMPWITAVPQYPKLARRERIEGEATICYTIDTKGRIRRPSVRRSSHKMFAKPSLKAIKQSSYEPLRPDQK